MVAWLLLLKQVHTFLFHLLDEFSNKYFVNTFKVRHLPESIIRFIIIIIRYILLLFAAGSVCDFPFQYFSIGRSTSFYKIIVIGIPRLIDVQYWR